MQHKASLSAVPYELRHLLIRDLKEKIASENIDAEVQDTNELDYTHGNLPSEIFLVGTSAAFTLMIPFIQDWLSKRRVTTEIIEEAGVSKMRISGSDFDRVMTIKSMADKKKS